MRTERYFGGRLLRYQAICLQADDLTVRRFAFLQHEACRTKAAFGWRLVPQPIRLIVALCGRSRMLFYETHRVPQAIFGLNLCSQLGGALTHPGISYGLLDGPAQVIGGEIALGNR
jgi:hypothetical protein